MGDTFARTGTLDAGDTAIGPDASTSSTPHYASLRPQEFTPPASPQPHTPYVAKRGFGSGRSRHPVQLHMDSAAAPTYDRVAHSPSPADSPTLPPMGLPSPQFSARQRAPSLLRHAAVPSPYAPNNGHSRADYPVLSPVLAPTMIRQGSGPGSPDLRAIYNPLASNPVHHNGPAWDSSSEDVSTAIIPKRARGLTSSSQPVFQPTPPLRSVTSIPDYGQFRGNDRANLSGTYKPNRGVPNWSHTDYYPPPPRQFRGEEPRASFRSAWTNASSSLMEASGTERSSIITARSSVISDRNTSIYSRDQSTDRLRDRDDSPETIQTSEAPEEDDSRDVVDDFIDAYCYDDDGDEQSQGLYRRSSRGYSSSPARLDPELSRLSQKPFREVDSVSSLRSSDHLKPWDGRPSSYLQDSSDGNIERSEPSLRMSGTLYSLRVEQEDYEETLHDDRLDTAAPDSRDTQTGYDPHLQHVHSQYGSRNIHDVVQQPDHEQCTPRQRSSEELPRGLSIPLQALALGAPTPTRRPNYVAINGQLSKGLNINRTQMTNIQRDISKLPQLPMSKSRLSRQDWAEIEAYSKRHSKRPSAARTLSNDSIKVNSAGMQSPPPKISDPLPALDEDETIPRRASTSVFDRKSALFNLGTIASTAAPVDKYAASRTAPQPSHKDGTVDQMRKTVPPAERDRYGFKKASDKINVSQYNAWATRYEEHISRRRNKWIALMSKQGLSTSNPTSFPEKCDKVKRYARKGFPPEWRGAMWWYYSGGQHLISQQNMVGLYASLAARVACDELNKDDKDAIERDLDRTFPDNIHFRAEPSIESPNGDCDDEPQMIKDLREVLSCFALNNPSIGYCQSLNFIAGLLLLFLKQDKERAFIMLTIITQNHLPGAHARNLANTEVNVLMMLIKDYLPKVWASINDTDLINSGAGSNAHPDSKFQRQPTVALSCTSWFMSIFVGVLPIETVLRVWDCFLYEGPRALYRYALAIFKLGEPDIRKFRPIDPELFMVVQNLPRTCLDPNVLHELAFVKKGFGNLTQTVIDQKRLFWREQNKMAHQTSVRSQRNKQATPPPKDDETDTDSARKILGLRRRASRRFRIGTRRDKL